MQTPDLNAKFCHRSTIARSRCNCIEALKDDCGDWIFERGAIGHHVESYFKGLFTARPVDFPVGLESLLPSVITDADNERLCRVPDNAEIWEAVKGNGSYKALGPDGFTNLFFQKYLSIVQDAVIKTVRHFFCDRVLIEATQPLFHCPYSKI